jgi:hypothetical protein
MADTRDGGFGEETLDLLRRSEESLQQGPPVCFVAFLWVHHVHKLLGGSLEVLQLLLPLLLLFTKRVADTCDGGFGDETEDLLRCSEESLQQGSPPVN